MPYVRSSPYNAVDRSGVRVQLGVRRKVTPCNSTDTEGEETEAAGPPKEEFVEDNQIEMKVCKTSLKLTRYKCSPSDKVLTILGSPRPGSYH